MSPWTSYYLSSKEYYPLYLLSGSTKFEWTHQLIPLFFIISCCDTWGIDIIFLSPTIHIDSSRKYEEFISVQLWSNHSQPIQVALISPSMTLSFFIIITIVFRATLSATCRTNICISTQRSDEYNTWIFCHFSFKFTSISMFILLNAHTLTWFVHTAFDRRSAHYILQKPHTNCKFIQTMDCIIV